MSVVTKKQFNWIMTICVTFGAIVTFSFEFNSKVIFLAAIGFLVVALAIAYYFEFRWVNKAPLIKQFEKGKKRYLPLKSTIPSEEAEEFVRQFLHERFKAVYTLRDDNLKSKCTGAEEVQQLAINLNKNNLSDKDIESINRIFLEEPWLEQKPYVPTEEELQKKNTVYAHVFCEITNRVEWKDAHSIMNSAVANMVQYEDMWYRDVEEIAEEAKTQILKQVMGLVEYRLAKG